MWLVGLIICHAVLVWLVFHTSIILPCQHILWGWMYVPHPPLVENGRDLAPLSLVVFECHCKLNRLFSQTLLWVLVQVFNALIVVLLHFGVSWYCGRQVHVVCLCRVKVREQLAAGFLRLSVCKTINIYYMQKYKEKATFPMDFFCVCQVCQYQQCLSNIHFLFLEQHTPLFFLFHSDNSYLHEYV